MNVKRLISLFCLLVLIGIFIISFGKDGGGDVLDDMAGVWQDQEGGILFAIIYKNKNLRLLFNDHAIPVKSYAVDNEKKKVRLNVVLQDGKDGNWNLHYIQDKDSWILRKIQKAVDGIIRKIGDTDKKSFNLRLTCHDGTQKNMTFVRQILPDDLKKYDKAETKAGVVPQVPTTVPEAPASIYYSGVESKIIEKLNVEKVALTFDACETKTPSYFDEKILSYLLENEIPFTVFMTGKFANRNRERLQEIVKLPFVEIENHSYNHYQHMETLTDDDVRKEVIDLDELLIKMIGKKTKYFRFPAGNYDERTLKLIGGMGYKVVHWTFPSGDPDKKVTPLMLTNWVVSKTKPGDILIFHINGRGYNTGDALPNIISSLSKKGIKFVKLEEGKI